MEALTRTNPDKPGQEGKTADISTSIQPGQQAGQDPDNPDKPTD